MIRLRHIPAMADVLLFLAMVYSLAICVHFLWEAWLIVRSDFGEIPVCRRWWCPDGIRNRLFKGNR
jgi:hypothetical protein